jgi:2-amino-4-hydroxy-6-hydroxymethyldihydropteridine diphosphokinase
MNHFAYIALGSNLGDRLENFRKVLQRVAPAAAVQRISSVYETEPWGITEQPKFLNMAAEVKTALSPRALLRVLKLLEEKIGRTKEVRNGPRIIDLDLIFFDDVAVSSDELEIPHPRMEGRAFVLGPLSELIPDHVHPLHGGTVTEMLARCDKRGIEPFPVPDGISLLPASSTYYVTDELAVALENSPEALELFFGLPASTQHEYLESIYETKREKTRQSRIAKTVAMLLRGETRK